MKFKKWLSVYGDQSFRGKCATETAEQITFFNQLSPELRLIAIHPRNEGKRTFSQAARQKAEGMTKGAADIIIPGAPAFVCELKRRDHTQSRWQDGQVEYLQACAARGAFVCVALGWEAAMQAVKDWDDLYTSLHS